MNPSEKAETLAKNLVVQYADGQGNAFDQVRAELQANPALLKSIATDVTSEGSLEKQLGIKSEIKYGKDGDVTSIEFSKLDSDSGSSVQYDQKTHQYEAAGSNVPLTDDHGVYYAANTDHEISYDQKTGQFEVNGTDAPVTFDKGKWYASGTDHQVSYNAASKNFVTPKGYPATYDAANNMWLAEESGKEYYYDSSNHSWEPYVSTAANGNTAPNRGQH